MGRVTLVDSYRHGFCIVNGDVYVPFSAPVGMPMRMFLGEAQWWEPLLSLAILIATCLGAIVVAAKIYENSLLRMGARVKLSEALSR